MTKSVTIEIDGEKIIAARIKGESVRDIAKRFKCSIEDVNQVLDIFTEQTLTNRLRSHSMALDLERLDKIQKVFEAQARQGDIKAAHLCVKICERREVLLGLCVPARVHHVHELLDGQDGESTSSIDRIRHAIERIRALPKPDDPSQKN